MTLTFLEPELNYLEALRSEMSEHPNYLNTKHNMEK